MKEFSNGDKTQIQSFIGHVMEEWNIPGMAVSVVKDSQVVFQQGFGLRNARENLKVTPKTVFAAASLTKSFTATALALLAERGRLDFEKPIREYLPDFEVQDPFVSVKITAADLLSHRSGMARHEHIWLFNPSTTRQDILGRLKFLEPRRDLRSEFWYSNLNYMIAGEIIRKVSGISWQEFVQSEILSPLGMTDTNFSSAHFKKIEDCALPYKSGVKGLFNEMEYKNVDVLGPAGSINSNAIDMTKWITFNLNKGEYEGKRIVSEKTIEHLQTPKVVVPYLPYMGPRSPQEIPYILYGYGWRIQPYRGYNMVFHGGNLEGFHSYIIMIPEESIGVLVLCNIMSSQVSRIIGYSIADRLLGLGEINWNERFKIWGEEMQRGYRANRDKFYDNQIKDTKPSHAMEEYVGSYCHPGYGILEITLESGKLKLTHNLWSIPLKHYHYDTFESNTMAVSFLSDKKGRIGSVLVPLEPSVKDIEFKRID